MRRWPRQRSASADLLPLRSYCIPWYATGHAPLVLSRSDAQVITIRIKEAEVAQSPRLERQIGCKRPACSDDSIALDHDIVDLEHKLGSGRDTAIHWIDYLPGAQCADAHVLTLHGDVRDLVLTTIVNYCESEHANVEVGKDVEIGREELDSQVHCIKNLTAISSLLGEPLGARARYPVLTGGSFAWIRRICTTLCRGDHGARFDRRQGGPSKPAANRTDGRSWTRTRDLLLIREAL
jgi:hypothetical protein